MKNLCVLQARLRSTRLPGKVLMKVKGTPLLEYQVRRLRLSKKIDKIVIATGIDKANDPIAKLAGKLEIDCFRGSENDVLDRYYQCSDKYREYETIIRITGDCPLIDPKVVDEVIEYYQSHDFDFVSNVDPPTFPDGMDTEIFSKNILEEAALNSQSAHEHEHVTVYFRNQSKYKKGNVEAKKDYSNYRLTVDNQEDFEVISFLIVSLRADASYIDYVKFLDSSPEIKKKNMHIQRNEGFRSQ